MFAQVRLVPAGPEKKPKRHLFGLLIVVGLLLLGGAAVMIVFQPGAPAPSNKVTVSVGSEVLATLSYSRTVPINQMTRGLNVFPAYGTKADDGAEGFMSYSARVADLLKKADVRLLRFPGGDWGDQHTLPTSSRCLSEAVPGNWR